MPSHSFKAIYFNSRRLLIGIHEINFLLSSLNSTFEVIAKWTLLSEHKPTFGKVKLCQEISFASNANLE